MVVAGCNFHTMLRPLLSRYALASRSLLGSARSPFSALAPLALRARLAIRTRRALSMYALPPSTPTTQSVRGVFYTTPSVVFSWSRVMHNGSLWKIMETSVHHISSSRKPTVAILSHVVDLSAPYLLPLPFPP